MSRRASASISGPVFLLPIFGASSTDKQEGPNGGRSGGSHGERFPVERCLDINSGATAMALSLPLFSTPRYLVGPRSESNSR